MRRLAVEAERFEFAQGREQQRPARSLIDAARFHSDQTVFDQVNAATAVAPADLVQCLDQRDGVETLAVDLYRRAFFKTDLDVLRLVRRFFGGDGQFEHRLFWFVCGVFEDPAFVREVPDVAVVAVDLFEAGRDRDPALVGVIDRVLARDDVPFAPGGDHRQFGGQGFECQFKTDLIVALACASVCERVAARPLRDFDLAFGDDGPGERSAEQVFVFVDGAGAQRGPDVFGDEFVAQVFDVDFSRARSDGLLLQSGQLIALPEVSGDRDYFAVIVLFQPGNDDRGVESARVGERDAFNSVGHLWIMPPVNISWVEVKQELYTARLGKGNLQRFALGRRRKINVLIADKKHELPLRGRRRGDRSRCIGEPEPDANQGGEDRWDSDFDPGRRAPNLLALFCFGD